jgi:hypothetical protein
MCSCIFASQHFICIFYVLFDEGGRRKNIFQEEAGDAPVREAGKISISFTPRVFPTPTRESLADQENTVNIERSFHYTPDSSTV